MSKYVIFDLDNCLADDEHRIPLIDWSQSDPEKRYAAYHAACGADVKKNGFALESHTKDGATPVFFTGRPTSVRGITHDWIHRNFGLGEGEYDLYTRPNGDRRDSVALKHEMLLDFTSMVAPISDIVAAYDDRSDIVDMYRSRGISAYQMTIHSTCAYTPPSVQVAREPDSPTQTVTAADILGEMAETYRERNKVYGDNFRRVGHVMQALHPEGVHMRGALDHELFHLWSLLIVKASRFAVSGLTHEDSIHDLCVYGAMIEAILKERGDGRAVQA